jgi:hypothetical protein
MSRCMSGSRNGLIRRKSSIMRDMIISRRSRHEATSTSVGDLFPKAEGKDLTCIKPFVGKILPTFHLVKPPTSSLLAPIGIIILILDWRFGPLSAQSPFFHPHLYFNSLTSATFILT